MANNSQGKLAKIDIHACFVSHQFYIYFYKQNGTKGKEQTAFSNLFHAEFNVFHVLNCAVT